MLYLCDNQALMKTVKLWVGEGGKATLVGAPDADILLKAIKELRERTIAGKVKTPPKWQENDLVSGDHVQAWSLRGQ